MSENGNKGFMYTVHSSLWWTVLGIAFLYSTAIGITLILPRFVDKTWKDPTSFYQVQMYEVADPNFYISSEATGVKQLQYVNHLKNGFSLLSFEENDTVRIVAPSELKRYITKIDEDILTLTSKLLLLRNPVKGEGFDAEKEAMALKSKIQAEAKEKGKPFIDYKILELYDPGVEEAFSVSFSEGVIEDFVDENYKILDPNPDETWHQDPGVIYVKNPQEYRVTPFGIGRQKGLKYDPGGKPIGDLKELTGTKLGFRSRKTLIELGERIYAAEGCYYCHTDQTRTLVQDVVANGAETFPAPPSSPNEYIYQDVTFPGTKRNGPDLSRTGIKRPGRDWHKSHFWSPRTESAGSIMPSFRHFFDFDPRGTRKTEVGVPNYRFEAIYQYLMTKGTRITPPTEAWWLGKDPVQTLKIIEGQKVDLPSGQ